MIVKSSEAETREENRGWKVIRVTGDLCPVRVCLDGFLGIQSIDDFEDAGSVLDVESSSTSCEFLFSRSRTCSLHRKLLKIERCVEKSISDRPFYEDE